MTIIRQIQSVEQIESHLLWVYRVQPMMTLRADAGSPITVRRFIFNIHRSEEIVVRTAPLALPIDRPVTISYFFNGFEHYFESEIISANNVKNVGTFFKIRRPMAIRAVNRRKWLRCYPGDQLPLKVTLDLPNSGPVTTCVQEFSANGFSLVVSSDCAVPKCQDEVDSELEIPGHGSVRATIVVRNLLESGQGVRIGTEINKISEANKKMLIDFAVAHTIKSKCAQRNDLKASPPTLCLIHDNCKMDDTLDYLEAPYRLIRHDIKSDWKKMLQMSPDALLFNLDSVNPSSLLPKLRSLANFQETPAIVIADEDKMDTGCDATVLSQFNDPAVLIETIEQSISTRKESLEILSSAYQVENEQKSVNASILIIDLIGGFSSALIEAIESQTFQVTINTGLTRMLDTVMKIKPVAVVIHSRIDGTFINLLRLLKMNKHTKGLPLVALSANVMSDRKNLGKNMDPNINLLPIHSEPVTLARQIAGIARLGR